MVTFWVPKLETLHTLKSYKTQNIGFTSIIAYQSPLQLSFSSKKCYCFDPCSDRRPEVGMLRPPDSVPPLQQNNRWTQIVGKGGLWVKADCGYMRIVGNIIYLSVRNIHHLPPL